MSSWALLRSERKVILIMGFILLLYAAWRHLA